MRMRGHAHTERTQSSAHTQDPINSGSPKDTTDPASHDPPTRRSFVFFGALAAASALPTVARAQGRSPRRRAIEPAPPLDEFPTIVPNESVAAFAEWDSQLGRLVRRVTYGITPAEVNRANQL